MKDDILDSPKTRTCSTQRSPRRKPGIGSVDVTTPHPDLTTCGTEPDADSTSGAVSSPPYSTESIVSTTDAADWKGPTTILLHKKGPEEDISNWRPIASQTRRASSMRRASQQGSRSSAVGTTGSPQSRRASCPMRSVLSTTLCFKQPSRTRGATEQKLQSLGSTCKTRSAQSLTPPSGTDCLRWIGLGHDSIRVVQKFYDGSTAHIRSSEGLTDDVEVASGVKQGCPLSPIVFNIVMESIIRAVTQLNMGYVLHGEEFSVLAYADDFAILSSSAAGLQNMLDVTATMAQWAEAQRTVFTIQGEPMVSLDENGVYEYLGVPTGFQKQPSAGNTIRSLLSDLDKIDRSLLAPWQKLDAVNTYVLSRLAFHLKAGAVPKKRLTQLDTKLKQLGKKWLHLPQRASAEVLYLRHQWGGMNLLPTNVIADVSQAVHGLRLLTSPDVTTARLARASLEEVVRKKLLRNPTTEEIAAFLTGATGGDLQRDSGVISSAWTRLRSATRRLRLKLDVCWKSQDQDLVLQLHDVNLHRQQAEVILKDGVRHFYLSRLLAKPDQGKVSDVTTLASASNHFMRGGNYTRFAEWRFIHRARLGVVPLNGCRRFGGGDKRCRRCGAAQ
ncbi:hypothetical protein ANN_00425 [Periplaneta americana]|uniref:Reverse transcriptase domain-containing protein n=1 Tax=Periplaneta americana TaxID=6978 RepID=A0ABQ8TSD7_PERAM|nr:hypothetical protein ANN_00425 [Periplaneta americana]